MMFTLRKLSQKELAAKLDGNIVAYLKLQLKLKMKLIFIIMAMGEKFCNTK